MAAHCICRAMSLRQRDDMRWEVYGEYCYAVCDDLDDALEFVASCRAFSDSQVLPASWEAAFSERMTITTAVALYGMRKVCQH